jgi:hypothetical protein
VKITEILKRKITTEKTIFINIAFHCKLFSDSDAAQLFKLDCPFQISLDVFEICENLIPGTEIDRISTLGAKLTLKRSRNAHDTI